ncbi:MAG TPA: peptidoglycan DD-metalloendopeptidase family protein [Propionibacteriaceae bacterium]|nr:peptidoglycan DD-metalloendopeptidase family protein [Propionibacteriaceae bacterium]
MPVNPPADGAPSASPVASAESRSWLWYGMVALLISALGLVGASAMPLATSARTTQSVASAGRPLPAAARSVQQPETRANVTDRGPLRAYAPGSAAGSFDAAADPDPTQAQVRAAVVKERAAQRAEDLSATAEDATRLARRAGSSLRAQDLAAADRSARENAVRIATERRRRAIAARVAAEVARRQAAAAAAAAAAADRAAAARAEAEFDDEGGSDGGASDRDQPDSGGDSSDSDTGDGNDNPRSTTGSSASPVPGAVIGSPFGATGLWSRYHTGLDLRAAHGTPVRAVTSGLVRYAGNSGSWAGLHVAIGHAHGMTTMSSHLSSVSVRSGQRVRAGQVIGRVGSTGRAFGAHLHFEVYPRGVRYGDVYRAINPVPWLQANGVRTR